MVATTKSLSTTTTPPPPPPPATREEEKQKLAAILFDIDGTLVNSDPLHFQIFQKLLLLEPNFNHNQPIDETFFRTHIAGRQNALIMEDLFPHWSLEKRESWSINKEAEFRRLACSSDDSSSSSENNSNNLKTPGLDRLRNWIETHNLHRAAVTNAPRLNAEALLNGIRYNDGFFECLIIGDECERAKPDPCPYLTACSLLGVRAEDCVVFEDSPSGVSAGVAAGAFVIGIRSGQEDGVLREAGCSVVVDDFEDEVLWDCLEERFSVV